MRESHFPLSRPETSVFSKIIAQHFPLVPRLLSTMKITKRSHEMKFAAVGSAQKMSGPQPAARGLFFVGHKATGRNIEGQKNEQQPNDRVLYFCPPIFLPKSVLQLLQLARIQSPSIG
jgi:hypothetical protein